ncbi:MAG: hypothetical protein M3P08_01280 [Thermoproteota archaeon]|nr:hypothetical protein [Thermoproteota archaeon]
MKNKSKKATPEEITLCTDCKSPAIINNGKRGRRVLEQILCCKDCGRQFRKQEVAFAE